MPVRVLISVICVLVMIMIGVAFLTWNVSYRAALGELNVEANRKILQVVDQFRGQLSAARVLPTLLARNSEIVDDFEKGFVSELVKEYLERARDISGAHEIRLLNSTGTQIFSTRNQKDDQSSIDTDYFKTAMQGALGVEVRYNSRSKARTLTFARSIISSDLKQIGVVVLEMEIDTLETEFRARPEIIMFLDSSSTVVFSNRTRLLFKKLVPYQSRLNARYRAYHASFENIIEHPIKESKYGFVSIWQDISAVPREKSMLMANRLILPFDLDAILLIDTKPALLQARKITSLVAALLILAVVSAIAIFQRRRRFIERIETEQALSKELDRRVELRSKELEHAQNELVQSAKLSALGKMSVGISHELSQPIASIQNFAVNAKRFIEKDRIDDSLENLNEIEIQTQRMSRIIRNLRDFSRKDAHRYESIDICKVINQVVAMLERSLTEEGVALSLVNVDNPIAVVGGEIRLQQVLINIISNAIEAMKHQTDKRISLQVERSDEMVEVSIRDNGPGLSEPDRVFEPFYTTKTGHHDDGLGLGLSIAYGFVESFGGSLRAKNSNSGGAHFSLMLPAVDKNNSIS